LARFEYVRGLVTNSALQRAADRLRAINGVSLLYASLAEKEYRQRPNLPIDTILVQPDAAQVIVAAINELLTATSNSSPVGSG
jgi:hypothetical protein